MQQINISCSRMPEDPKKMSRPFHDKGKSHLTGQFPIYATRPVKTNINQEKEYLDNQNQDEFQSDESIKLVIKPTEKIYQVEH